MTHEEAIKILGNVSIDYTGMNQEEIDQMDEALTLAFKALELFDRPSGHWIHKGDGDICSACFEMVEGFPTRYCPNCGAKMKEEST